MCLALLSFPIPSRSMNILLSQQEHAISKITEIAELVNETLSIDSFNRRSSHDASLFVASIGINFHPSAFEYFLGFSFNRRGEEKKTKIETIIWELRTMGTSTSCTTYPMRAHPKRGKWISFGLLLNWHLIIFFAFCRIFILLTHGEGRWVSSCHLNNGFVIGISRETISSSWRYTR